MSAGRRRGVAGPRAQVRRLVPACVLRRSAANVAVEAALVFAIVLVPLITGALDFGTLLFDRARLDQAVDGGLYYSWGDPAAISPLTLQAAALAAYGPGLPLPVITASVACYCVNPLAPAPGSNPVFCLAGCPSNQVIAQYVSLTASAWVPLPVPLPGIASPFPLTVAATVRSE